MSFWAFFNILVLGFLVGTSMVATRFSVGQFEPFTYISLRFLIAAPAFLVLLGIRRRKMDRLPTRSLWVHSAVLGVFGTAVPTVSVVMSMQYLSSGLTAVLLTTIPALTVLMAHFFLRDEKLNLTRGLGVLLALAGAVLLAARNETGLAEAGEGNVIGYAYALAGMLALSTMTVYVRKFMQNLPSLQVASGRVVTAAVVMFPVALLTDGFALDRSVIDAYGWFALLYSTLMATFFGMILEVSNIQRFGASTSSIVSYLIPIVAGFGGVLLLGERITVGILIGISLILGGIFLINRGARQAGGVPAAL